METRTREIPETLSLKLANQIGELILQGEIPEGAQLKILDIAKKYNVSQTVAREALLNLEKSYLVEHLPRRGNLVRKARKSEAVELYEIKKRLLGYACRRLCSEFPENPELRDDMIACYQRLLDALQANDVPVASEENQQLTYFILDHLEPGYLRDTLGNIEYQTKRFRIREAFQTETGRVIAAYHIGLMIQAQNDPDAAERRMLDYMDAIMGFVFHE